MWLRVAPAHDTANARGRACITSIEPVRGTQCASTRMSMDAILQMTATGLQTNTLFAPLHEQIG